MAEAGPYVLGLTGSIGMGKSTTAAMFAALGVPVWDADAAVHRLYAPGGAAVAGVALIVPDAVRDGGVDRAALKVAVAKDPTLLNAIEALVHPLVADDRARFLNAEREADLVLLDIPLLFENGLEAVCHGVVVVSVEPEVQMARLMARPGATPGAMALLLSRQMPDAEKRARATWVILTDTLDGAQAHVRRIVSEIRSRPRHA